MKGTISDIKRFAVHDGPGIRTTIFFKGCPLKCFWCHNPESISFLPQLAYRKEKCINCGRCAEVCPSGAHIVNGATHNYIREKCKGNGLCANVCLGRALTFYGRSVTVNELMPELLEDLIFYQNSSGGITLSGGEPLAQVDFAKELLMAVKEKGLNTALDTCGYVSRSAIESVLPYTDIFLYDLKHIDSMAHKKGTGRSNEIIIDNLKFLSDSDKKIEIRYPLIPGFNDNKEVLEKAAEFLGKLKNITGIKVLPYHKLAGSKYEALDMENTLPERTHRQDELYAAKEIFRKFLICKD